MSEVLRGTEFIVGPRIRVTQNVTQGKSIEYYYEGTLEQIEFFALSLGSDVDYTLDNTSPPKGTLVVRQQGVGDDQTLLSASWDMRSNNQQKSLFEHPVYIGLGDDVINDVRDALKKNTPNKTFGNTLATQLYRKMLRGQDYYFVSLPIFKFTSVLKTRRNYAFAEANQNRVYTSAQLVIEANPPAPYIDSIANKEASMRADVFQGAIPSGFTLGWLKQSYELITTPGNKLSANIEYLLDAWPTGDRTYLASTVS